MLLLLTQHRIGEALTLILGGREEPQIAMATKGVAYHLKSVFPNGEVGDFGRGDILIETCLVVEERFPHIAGNDG